VAAFVGALNRKQLQTFKEMASMKREALADEIRGAGNAVRFADGPVLIGRTENGKMKILHSPEGKLGLPDEEIIRMAATCSTCEAVASKGDIELAGEWADCYQSFARFIWPCINHEKGCPAKPYISVSTSASKRFQKIKAKFDAKRQAWAERKAKMTPEELKAHQRDRQKAREGRELVAFAEMLKKALKAFEEQESQAARKPKAKKAQPAKQTKKAKKKPAKKKPAEKKPTKRKRR